MATLTDRFITFLSGYDAAAETERIKAQDEILAARWEKILSDESLSPDQKLIAERELQKIRGARVDLAEGNAKVFADEAAKAGKEAINSVAGFGFKLIPFWVWIVLGIVVLGYVAFLFSPLLRAKGLIK